MDPAARTEPEARELLALERRDPKAAEQAMAALPIAAQVAVVCEAPLADRGRILGLVEHPEALIPEMPPAELCFTIKAIGLADAAWVLEYATPDQVVAAFDLDAWRGNEVDVTTANEWLQALARTSEESRVRALEALDSELLVLALRARIGVEQKPDDDQGWSPPDSSQTLEGQFHYWALADQDDLSDVTQHLRALFEGAYWSYFRLMLAIQWEIDSDSEEWALRWRTGRLEDLGFPTWDESVRIYRFLDTNARRALPAEEPVLPAEWALPIWLPQLPETGGAGDRIFRAIAEQDEPERRASFYAFVALANRIAVADRMPLGDAESTPAAIAKAARFASAGLAYLADEHKLRDPDLLRRVSIEHLFRVGANLDPDGARS
jgi:uncharacterized protein DUF6178